MRNRCTPAKLITARRNLRNTGSMVRVKGDDAALNDLVDELQYTPSVRVLNRKDLNGGQGMLVLETKFPETLVNMVNKHGLAVES